MSAHDSVFAAFESKLAERGFTADSAQYRAIRRLQRLADELQGYVPKPPVRGWRKWFEKPPAPAPQSVYFWGGVGRGKSFLMDCFFAAVPFAHKQRVHFHAFMQRVQNDLKNHNQQPDPLQVVADHIAAQASLLCFDEFHVSDIADAMILGRLLEALAARGVVLVMTTNYPPDGLYPNGLMRVNFLPTIAFIKQHFDVLEIDDGTDYRLRTLTDMQLYLTPDDDAARARLREDFVRLTGCQPQPGEMEVLGRKIATLGQATGVVWFDFAALCITARSQNDYLEIAREKHTVLLSGVPVMSAQQASEARRFTWLIDVLYDCRVKLICSAQAAAEQLYTSGQNANEFARTASRLTEMRSHEYLVEAHRARGDTEPQQHA